MARSFRRLLAVAFLAVLTLQLSASGREVAAVPNDDRAIAHTLNRLAFGARPGDIERVRRIGLGAWIEQQLQPNKIANSALETRLAKLTTTHLDSATVARDYFIPSRQAQRQRQLAQSGARPGMEPPAPSETAKPRVEGPAMMAPEMRAEQQVMRELTEAKILRAVHSERQLEEVLTDFWFNHFNVFARKGQTIIYVGEYEREAIRPHVLGNFRELLGATANRPAMLFYLDNWLSADPHAQQPLQRPGSLLRRSSQEDLARAKARQRRGLNENYARELLELHTLGVDGGYTQKDVIEVARAFTGWTIGTPNQPGFRFTPPMHDRGEKTVLGHAIPAGGGIEDGERVLDILAAHPSTAKHIALKLAQRFVSDTPPAGLVKRAADRFTATKGDLREVVRTIVTSREFFAAEAYRAKVKTPFEFVTTALRVTAVDLPNALPVARALQTMGMPLYLCQPPTGYDETSETWVSSGALVNRMNFAVELAGNRLRAGGRGNNPAQSDRRAAAQPEQPAATGNLAEARERLIREALTGDVSTATRATINKATTHGQMVALVIGSPEFQRQ